MKQSIGFRASERVIEQINAIRDHIEKNSGIVPTTSQIVELLLEEALESRSKTDETVLQDK